MNREHGSLYLVRRKGRGVIAVPCARCGTWAKRRFWDATLGRGICTPCALQVIGPQVLPGPEDRPMALD